MSNKDVMGMQEVIPDFKLMKALQTQMSDLIDEHELHTLPAVQQSLGDWKDLAWSAERSLHQGIVECIALLQGRDFTRFSNEQVRKDKIASVVAQQAQMLETLAQQVLRVERFGLPDFASLGRTLEPRVAALAAESQAINLRLDGLVQQKADLDQIIAAFETPSVSKIFKGLIPSEKELDLMLKTVTDPKINADVLKAALRKLESHADVLACGRKFNDLLKARARLEEKISDARTEARYAKSHMQAAQHELSSNKALAELEPIKEQWLAQILKVEQAWQAQSQALQSLGHSEEVVVALGNLCDYMLAVRSSYERA